MTYSRSRLLTDCVITLSLRFSGLITLYHFQNPFTYQNKFLQLLNRIISFFLHRRLQCIYLNQLQNYAIIIDNQFNIDVW